MDNVELLTAARAVYAIKMLPPPEAKGAEAYFDAFEATAAANPGVNDYKLRCMAWDTLLGSAWSDFPRRFSDGARTARLAIRAQQEH